MYYHLFFRSPKNPLAYPLFTGFSRLTSCPSFVHFFHIFSFSPLSLSASPPTSPSSIRKHTHLIYAIILSPAFGSLPCELLQPGLTDFPSLFSSFLSPSRPSDSTILLHVVHYFIPSRLRAWGLLTIHFLLCLSSRWPSAMRLNVGL